MRSIWQTFEKRVDMTRYVPAQDIINSAQGGISSHKIDPRSLKTPKFSRCAGLRARFARPAARASLAQLSPRKKGLNHVPLAHPEPDADRADRAACNTRSTDTSHDSYLFFMRLETHYGFTTTLLFLSCIPYKRSSCFHQEVVSDRSKWITLTSSPSAKPG